jgi:hypothetical protein
VFKKKNENLTLLKLNKIIYLTHIYCEGKLPIGEDGKAVYEGYNANGDPAPPAHPMHIEDSISDENMQIRGGVSPLDSDAPSDDESASSVYGCIFLSLSLFLLLSLFFSLRHLKIKGTFFYPLFPQKNNKQTEIFGGGLFF